MPYRVLAFCFLVSAASALDRVTLPAGRILSVKSDARVPMRPGETLVGRLTEPVYEANALLLPAGCAVTGHIAKLISAGAHTRLRSAMDGDFTPLHDALVVWDRIQLPSGESLAIQTNPAAGLAEAVTVTADPAEHIAAKADLHRAADYLEHKLPYHGEHIEPGASYHAALATPLLLDGHAATVTPSSDLSVALTAPISTRNADPGAPVEAVVTQPFYDRPGGTVLFPQGTRITGRVVQTVAASKCQHQAYLRFHMDTAITPDGRAIPINASVVEAEASSRDSMKLDGEGGLRTTRSKVKMIFAPLTVIGPARAAADPSVEKTGFARATSGLGGFGLVGSAIAQANPATATGIGAYGAAKSLYGAFMAKGKDVTLPAGAPVKLRLEALPRPELK